MRRKITFLIILVLLASSSSFSQSIESNSLHIVLISDLNDAYGSTTYSQQVEQTLNFIEKNPPDLVLCAGDMVAGQSLKLGETSIRKMWQSFNSLVLQRIVKTGVPFAFTFGNHDGSGSQRFAHERQIARQFWHKNKPTLPYASKFNFPDYYSFSFKNVYFAIIDAAQSRLSIEQQNWLRQSLTSKPAINARLRIVMGHLPLFALAKGRNRSGDVLADGDKLLGLFNNLGVDYYISGHHHAFYASRNGNLKMIAAGALGGGPRKLIGSDLPPRKTFTLMRLPPGAKEFRITTYNPGSELQELVPGDLPAKLEGFNGTSTLYWNN